MATPHPKYVAAKAFRCAGRGFAKGDPVENPVVLDATLPFGDEFITTDTKRGRQAAGADPTTAADVAPDKE